MKINKQKISYDKESKVLSVEMQRGKSVDSDIHDNVVIDYDRKGRVVRVNVYDINFSAFKEIARGRKMLAPQFSIPVLVQ